jgi:hypothetical protein
MISYVAVWNNAQPPTSKIILERKEEATFEWLRDSGDSAVGKEVIDVEDTDVVRIKLRCDTLNAG